MKKMQHDAQCKGRKGPQKNKIWQARCVAIVAIVSIAGCETVNTTDTTKSASHKTKPSEVGLGALIGSAAGAVIGHQFGKRTGNEKQGTIAGALSGALIGMAIGQHVANQRAKFERQQDYLAAVRQAGETHIRTSAGENMKSLKKTTAEPNYATIRKTLKQTRILKEKTTKEIEAQEFAQKVINSEKSPSVDISTVHTERAKQRKTLAQLGNFQNVLSEEIAHLESLEKIDESALGQPTQELIQLNKIEIQLASIERLTVAVSVDDGYGANGGRKGMGIDDGYGSNGGRKGLNSE